MLEYNLDISPHSIAKTYTPTSIAKTFPFYASEYGYFEAGRAYYTVRDSRHIALLLFTCAGQGEMKYKGARCVLSPGCAMLVDCVELHEYRTISQEPWVFYWMHLQGAGLAGYRFFLLERPELVNISNTEEFLSCFQTIAALDMQSGVLACAEASHNISKLLLLMLQAQSHKMSSGPVCVNEIQTVIEYIRTHYAQKLTLDDFLRITNFSKYHFIRIFKRHMGVTPYRYVQQYRIDRAQIILRTTNLAISEVAAQTGYADPANFIHHFRNIVGVTPAKYRKESYNWA